LKRKSCPLLRRQKGFLDELLLVTPEKRELEAITLWRRFERHKRAIDVPKITVRTCEFDSDLPSVALFRIDGHYVAFALFLGEAINDEDLLAEFY
jgi:hypothetical protein